MNSKTKHLVNYLIGEFFTKGIVFLSIPILTRLLTPEDYGIISVYESLILIFTSILGLGIGNGISRYYFEPQNDMENFLKNNICFIFCYSFLVAGILFKLSDFIANKIDLNSNIIKLSIIAGGVGVIIDIYQRLLISAKKSKEYNILGAIKSLIVLSLTIILAYFLIEKFYSKIYSIIVYSFIFILFLLIKYKIYFTRFKFQFEYIKYALGYSIPLIPAVLSNFILAQFDRIAISNITGDLTKTGLYSFAYNIGMIQQIVVISLINTLRPYFYDYLNKNDNIQISLMVEKYSKFVYVSAIGLILFSKEIVMIMANKKYYEALELVPIVIIGYVFVFFYSLYFQYASYSKKTGTISINTFLAGGLNIYLNYKYIPIYGYKAAAFTTVVSYFVLFALHFCNSKYILKMRVIPLKIFYKDFIIFIILITLIYFLSKEKNERLIFVFKILLEMITIYIYLVRRNKEWIKNGVLKRFVKK